MNRDRLKKLASDERFIAGIYNYCDRWCERCPQTLRRLNFSVSEEEFSDPETRDIRNEAFWKKLSGILGDALELLREGAKEWAIDGVRQVVEQTFPNARSFIRPGFDETGPAG